MSTGIDSGADFHTLLVDLLGRLRIFDEWETVVDIDAAANDSDNFMHGCFSSVEKRDEGDICSCSTTEAI